MATEGRPYCTAVIIRDVDPPRVETVELGSFEEVAAFLGQTYNWFSDVIADGRAVLEPASEPPPLGGFGVALTNRWASEIEVGTGRDLWCVFRREPRPGLCFSDNPPVDNPLVFYLDGWHYTSLESRLLVSRGACLEALRRWLDTNEFPGPGVGEQRPAEQRR